VVDVGVDLETFHFEFYAIHIHIYLHGHIVILPRTFAVGAHLAVKKKTRGKVTGLFLATWIRDGSFIIFGVGSWTIAKKISPQKLREKSCKMGHGEKMEQVLFTIQILFFFSY